jgi:hypothetical protein
MFPTTLSGVSNIAHSFLVAAAPFDGGPAGPASIQHGMTDDPVVSTARRGAAVEEMASGDNSVAVAALRQQEC